MRRERRIILTAVLLTIFTTPAMGQKWSISTNLIDYANLITLNAEGNYSLSQHWSITLNSKYNPFIFNAKKGPGKQFQNKSLILACGAKFWPFFVYSGFFYGFKFQWQQYNRGGISSPETFQGDAFGAGLNFGYALMLSKNFNLEFGIGLWGGWSKYISYSCPKCGRETGRDDRWFVYPNDIQISIAYTF